MQAPLLEFCYQTALLASAGPRGQFLPVNKVTVLARTLQLSLLPSPSMSRPPSAAATGPRWSNKEGKEGMGGPMSSKPPPSMTWLIGPVGKGRGTLLPGTHSAPGSGGAAEGSG